MEIAIRTRISVGVRELRDNLSRYVESVREGDEVIVTDHGRPVARLTSVAERPDVLAELINRGEVTPPSGRRRTQPRPIRARGTVSDLVSHQRR